MENLNDLKILFSFVPCFKDKSVLQLGSDLVFTELLTSQADASPKKVVVSDSDEVALQTNKETNASRAKNLEYVQGCLKSLSTNLGDQK